MNLKLSIAYFISSHGFGHAARASAVMNAVFEKWPFVRFEIFTETPVSFFERSLDATFTCHHALTDIGLVQPSPLQIDFEKTVKTLNAFLPFPKDQTALLSERVVETNCQMVICDISPLGIVVAKETGIPSVLIENFTWDWIYSDYEPLHPELTPHIHYLASVFNSVDYRMQAEPACEKKDGCLLIPPIARRNRLSADQIRRRLGVGDDKKMALITMGGIPATFPFLEKLAHFEKSLHFVLPGAYPDIPASGERRNNITVLPHFSDFYHPDLVNASDVVVGKAGYSTLTEVFHAGVPFGYVSRKNFRESGILSAYIQSHMKGIEIGEEEFDTGRWLNFLPELLAMSKKSPNVKNGAAVAAEHICKTLVREKEILAIVDQEGTVLGAAPRKQVHGDNSLLHSVVHLLVVDRNNRLLLQKRSMTKRVAPGRWDTSVGGHVDFGETVAEALSREAGEELGILPSSPQFTYVYIHSNAFESELVYSFVCRHDGDIHFNPEEIDTVRFWELEEILNNLGKKIFSDNFEDEFRRYVDWTKDH